MNAFTKIIAERLSLHIDAVENTLKLLDEGCTIPFISRYRKERTGGLDEVQIAQISDLNDKMKEMTKRKETIVSTISEQGKMTAELRKRIDECWSATELEDIYLPYKPKRRTRAQVAREQGLEPLANIIMMQREQFPERAAERFVKGDVKDVAAALKGATGACSLPPRGYHNVEGGKGEKGYRRGSKILGLLRLVGTAETLLQPPTAGYAARRERGHTANKHKY